MAADETKAGSHGGTGKRVLQTSASSSDEDSTNMSASGVQAQHHDDAGEGPSSGARESVTSNVPALTERQQSTPSVPFTADERASIEHSLELVASAKLAEVNTKRNRPRMKERSQSTEFRDGIRGDGAPYRRKSFVGDLKSLTRYVRPNKPGPQIVCPQQGNLSSLLSLRRFTEPSVVFEKDVRVKKVDCSPDGDPPAAVPQIPVFEEEIREPGVILDEAGRQAAKMKKGQQAYTADFERRIANSRRSSNASQDGSRSYSLSPAIMAAVDEMDQLQLSRGELPTSQERRSSIHAGRYPESSSTDHDPDSSPDFGHASDESATHRGLPADQAGQAPEASSTIRANDGSHPQAGQISQSPRQASSSLPAVGDEAIEESLFHQENISPSTPVGPFVDVAGDPTTNIRPSNPEDDARVSDDNRPADFVVRAQRGIIYDQDTSIAIQSLSCAPRLPNSSFSPCELDFHTCPADLFNNCGNVIKAAQAKLLEDALLGQSHQDILPSRSNDVIPQRRTPRCGIFSFQFLAYCLDEFWGELYPESCDAAPSSEARQGKACLKDSQADRVNRSLSVAQSAIDEDQYSCHPDTSVQEAVRAMSKPKDCFQAWTSAASEIEKQSFDVCCQHSQPTTQSSPKTEESDNCHIPSPSVHCQDARCILSDNNAPLSYQPLTADFGMGPALPTVGENHDFGTILERAYISSCSTQYPSAGAATLIPPNAVCRFPTQLMTCHGSKPDGATAECASIRRIENEYEAKLLPLKSGLYPLAQYTSMVNLDAKNSLGFPRGHRWRTLKRTSRWSRDSGSGLATRKDSTSLCRSLDGAHDRSSGASDKRLPCMLPFHEGSGSNDAATLLLHVSKRSSSTSRTSSQCSVITALNDSDLATCNDPEPLGSTSIIPEASFIEACDLPDGGDNASGNFSTQSSVQSTNPDSLSLKRLGSCSTSSSKLSIITTFTSHSKTSTTSKASINSCSSSGGSGGSSLRFGRDGGSRRWTPWSSKSPASVCTNKDLERFDGESKGGTANSPPIKHSHCFAASAAAIRKFVMKCPPTQPDRCARSVAKKLELRRVVQNTTSVGYLGAPGHDWEETPDGESMRCKDLDISEEGGAQSSSSELDAARLPATEDSDASRSLGSPSLGDEY